MEKLGPVGHHGTQIINGKVNLKKICLFVSLFSIIFSYVSINSFVLLKKI